LRGGLKNNRRIENLEGIAAKNYPVVNFRIYKN
jgi:hypothetical protein